MAKRLDSAAGLRLVSLLCLLAILAALVIYKQVLPRMQAAEASSGPDPVEIEIIADDLEHPWALAFLPNADMLVTEKPGRVLSITEKLKPQITGQPPIKTRGPGGLIDVVVHPPNAK
ncbi:MAG: PQQ-dependent sugar dehydrogenase, partial [Salinisphaeraceae bacterium]|nr:PQQ-dependent sugar dehydrogenase [Salinisphaeraceae bacterium]